MNIRRLVSLTSLFSFLWLALTGFALYLMPHGRVAYWSDWHWLGLSKNQWGALHVTGSALFCVVGLWHIVLNWKAIVQYLTKRYRDSKRLSPELAVAVVVTAALAVGTIMAWPPFIWPVALGDRLKEAGSRTYGEPPYGHAELSSVKTLALRLQLDLDAAMTALRQADLVVTSENNTILGIAQANTLSPDEVYRIIQSGQSPTAREQRKSGLPADPPPGLGQRTLKNLAAEYGLDVKAVVAGLRAAGIDAEPGQSLREVAQNAGQDPHAVYTLIQAASGP